MHLRCISDMIRIAPMFLVFQLIVCSDPNSLKPIAIHIKFQVNWIRYSFIYERLRDACIAIEICINIIIIAQKMSYNLNLTDCATAR